MKTLSRLAGLLACALPLQATELLYVQIRTAPLRASPAPFAPITATLEYGERVHALDTSGAWKKVRPESRPDAPVGWIHVTALTPKALALQAGTDTSVRASSDEVALAGKGFTAQVEKQMKAAHPDLPFVVIDRMEKQNIPLPEIRAFLEKGGLTPQGATP